MMKIVESDPWLRPVEIAVEQRHCRFEERLQQIKHQYGSLQSFASRHQFLGFNYDIRRKGWTYREWAPAAHHIFLMGDFNGWNRHDHPLDNIGNGVWEIFLPDRDYANRLTHGSLLKVVVQSQIGEQERIPVYIRRVIQDDDTKNFNGQFWNPSQPYTFQHAKPTPEEPLLVYEAHIGMAQEKEGVGSFQEFADVILPHIKDYGYNAIQIMGIAEHPYYGSFGYHVSNFYAPSSRFGTPEDLMGLVDKAHSMGILVIMDIVHAHTVKNIREGLFLFDGSDGQYLHTGVRGNHPQWDSKLFDYGKEETLAFLLSNLRYWIETYNFDGFRFDGVTSMMYLHHGIDINFEKPEQYFMLDIDHDAITYLQLANTLIHQLDHNIVSIAEDVSGMPGLCAPINDGGIGFDYRLGMGLPDFWIKELKDHPEEQWNMNEFFFTMTNRLTGVKTIAYAESHDQAMVGDKTIAFRLMDKEMYDKMSITSDSIIIDRGIALHKMIRLFTLTLGGDAWLNFMGNEFGHPEWIDFPRQGNNWSFRHAQRQWSLLHNKNLKYQWLGTFDKTMLKLVKQYNIMNGSNAWLLKADEENKTIVYEKANMIFVFNWGSSSIADYVIPVTKTGDYRILLTTDDPSYGGFNNIDTKIKYPSMQNDDIITMSIYNVCRCATIFIAND